jgi:uncharacterized protein YqeY
MNLLAQIKNDQEEARRRSVPAPQLVSLLTTLYAEAAIVGKNAGNRESTDGEVIAVIKKFIKGVEECLAVCKDELKITAYKLELEVLLKYLPKQLTFDEMKNRIDLIVAANPSAKMPDIMKYFKENHNGLYDGKVLSQLVKEKLSGK